MTLAPDATLADVATVVRKHGTRCIQHIPLRTVGETEHRQKLKSSDRINCPLCDKTFAGGVIVTHPVERQQRLRQIGFPEYRGDLVYRQFFCNHCDAIFCWYQELRADGSLGVELGRYKTIRDRHLIDKFLHDHPEAKGVE